MQIETNDLMQIVDINLDVVNCEICGANLVDLANFIYEGKSESSAFDRKEFCRCRHCTTPFILHYDIFDSQGHIYPMFLRRILIILRVIGRIILRKNKRRP